MKQTSIARLLWPLVICAVATLIFLIRLHGGTDLESYGQPATIGRLLDLTTQGHYFVQRDLNGDMMVAPPLHTWLIAASTALFGDGSARFLKESMDLRPLAAICTRAGGEVISADEL